MSQTAQLKPPPDSHEQDSGSRWRTFFTIILAIVFFLSFLGFVGGLVVRRHLLDPNLYSQALAENNAYERIYSDLLADPAVEQAIKDATGINIDIVVGEALAQVVAASYMILPPAEMQRGVEKFFTGLTSYLSGDTAELQEDLNWGSRLTPEVLSDRIVKAAGVVANGVIEKGTPVVVEKTEPFMETRVIEYLDQVGGGRLGPMPSVLFRMSVKGVLAGDNTALIDRMLGPAAATTGDQTKLQMEAALAEDDLTGAVTIALQERLTIRVESALAAAEPRLAETRAVLGISGAAAAIGETRDQVVTDLNVIRGYMIMLKNLMIVLAVVMLVSLILIMWLNSDSIAEAFRAAGWTLLISSGLMALVWVGAGLYLRPTVANKLAAAQFGPNSLDTLLDDVVGSLAGGVWSSIWQVVLPFLVGGLVLLAFGYSKGLIAFLKRILGPLWDKKWLVLAGALGLFVFVPLMFSWLSADARAANAPCNGYAELCDRKANEVAYATSHNAMSIAEYGWLWPMHDGTITEQLNAGVRALLIDSHYLDTEAQRAEVIAALPPEAVAAAQKAIATIKPPAQEGEFLCHKLCGFGYTDMIASLGEVRTFLVENPREVLWIVIEDEITNDDTLRAFEEAELTPYIYTHQPGAEWPTLREMIDSNKRLVVMAEKQGPPPDWYANVWDETMETPYTFVTEAQLSCRENRGGAGKPFFLMNHWIQRGAPNRVDGAVLNEYDYLLARARQCEAERGKMPNFIAVNWYSQGDLVDVVNTLNGVGAAPVAQ